jgi:hypothetical protein
MTAVVRIAKCRAWLLDWRFDEQPGDGALAWRRSWARHRSAWQPERAFDSLGSLGFFGWQKFR